MTAPMNAEAVAQMVADLTHTDGPDGEMSMMYRGVIADALRSLAAENATLRAERDDLAVAIDSIETSNGLTHNGNLWRFWANKAREMASKFDAMRASEATAVVRVGRLTDAAAHVLHDIDELAANSEGVAGLHMNGNVAEWSEIMDGGAFGAWLCSAEVLRAIIAEGTPT